MRILLVVLLLAIAISGCGNDPYVNPDTSRAITQRQQYEEMQKQNEILARLLHDIAISLRAIAENTSPPGSEYLKAKPEGSRDYDSSIDNIPYFPH